MKAPIAKTETVIHELHGRRREDRYAWLRDARWQEVMRDPSVLAEDIRAYLDAENAYCAELMADTAALQEQLFAEMKGRIKEDESSVPEDDGPYSYYTRFREGGQHPLFCRTPRGGGVEELLYDGDAAAEGTAFFDLGSVSHSETHRRLLAAVDTKGSELYSVRVKDLESGGWLADEIGGTNGNAVWARDGESFFYTLLDENHRPYQVRRHRLGQAASADPIVYEEKDPGFFVSVTLTESDRFVVIDAHDHTTSECRLIEGAAPDTPPRLVAARERDVEYDVSHNGERLFILTNAEGAEDFKICEAPLAEPGRENWTDLVPHEAGRLILSMTLFKHYLVRLERVNALPRIVVRALKSGEEHAIGFGEQAYALGVLPGLEFDSATLRFVYSSPTTPQETYDYDMVGRGRALRKRQEVPSGHDADDYRAKRILVPAPDGEEVPVTLLRHKDTPEDGSAPLLLYGYGAYGMSIPAGFGTGRLSLVDRGFIHATAHIRGGMDKGYAWYRHGKLMEKKNSFTDFVAAAEGLIGAGLARPGEIAIHGGSAGGMLVGACCNLRPDLWKAVVAEVPFVDVLNTMCDDSLPLTPPEWPEWGNPIVNAEAYDYIASYSPYDNVGAKDYPNILATAGLTDPRVTYWEPAKWVARLRALKTDGNLLLLRTYMEAGHGGASGRFDKLKEVALVYAFLLKVFARA